MMSQLKSKVPWWVKVGAKVVLSRLPMGYGLWKGIGLFEHGQMDHPEYAYQVFKAHYDRAHLQANKKGFVGLELGPGDSLFSAVIARAFGAKSCYLIDQGHFADWDLRSYRALVDFLNEKSMMSLDLGNVHSIDELLEQCGGIYETEGLASLRQIPSGSIDFVWSQAVMEHIRKNEFHDTMKEIRRALHPDGVCSFRIDLKDHLGGSLNNLRFSDRIWESEFMARSGFYTNRLRYSEMIELFKQVSFDVEVFDIDHWDSLPISRRKLAKPFADYSDEELCISGFDIVLRSPMNK